YRSRARTSAANATASRVAAMAPQLRQELLDVRRLPLGARLAQESVKDIGQGAPVGHDGVHPTLCICALVAQGEILKRLKEGIQVRREVLPEALGQLRGLAPGAGPGAAASDWLEIQSHSSLPPIKSKVIRPCFSPRRSSPRPRPARAAARAPCPRASQPLARPVRSGRLLVSPSVDEDVPPSDYTSSSN